MLVRSQFILPYRTNLPQDVISNTMWFQTAEMSLAEAGEAIMPNLRSFYSAVYANVSGQNTMSAYVAPANAHVLFYNYDAPPPRVPYRVNFGGSWGGGIGQGTVPIPTEVACVLSYRAALENGVPAARRRGRIYLGGLGTGGLTNSSPTTPFFPQFNSTWRNQIIAGVVDYLLTPVDWGGAYPPEDIVWSVHSTTDNFSAPVVAGWIDNTPDTQRRRGVNASSRTSFP